MAIYMNHNQINEYMKIGNAKDACYICAKKDSTIKRRDVYDILRSFEGKIENKKVIVVKRSGIDTCICMDCIEEVYNTHIKTTLPANETIEEEIKKEEVKKEEIKKTKK